MEELRKCNEQLESIDKMKEYISTIRKLLNELKEVYGNFIRSTSLRNDIRYIDYAIAYTETLELICKL